MAVKGVSIAERGKACQIFLPARDAASGEIRDLQSALCYNLTHGYSPAELEEELLLRFRDEENGAIAGHVMMLLGRAARLGGQVQIPDRFRVTVVE